MTELPKVVFVSNYINHHQIPVCNELFRLLGKSFAFIQTEPIEEERLAMGWQTAEGLEYLFYSYKQPEICREMIERAKLVIFGGCEDESYITNRLEQRKPVIRYSERIYKEGQWKAISPRGLRRKYLDHTRYRKSPVYLLCSGAYVPSDFHIVRAYPEKMLRWGYFPPHRTYDIDQLISQKGYSGDKIPYLLWAGRMIDWKHPEYAIEVAHYLKTEGLVFHLDMIGDGPERENVRKKIEEYGLQEQVRLLGSMKPDEVRKYMEKADIFLFTSDRKEGWGAVANEAMNSGCAMIASHMIGAVPFLIKDGKNGCVYKDGDIQEISNIAKVLVKEEGKRKLLGRHAYETIHRTWNAEYAADRLLRFAVEKGFLLWEDTILPKQSAFSYTEDGPCSKAEVLSERRMYACLKREVKEL